MSSPSPPNQSLRCSELHTRDLTVPNCINGLPCQRTYHFYLPRVLCHGGARRRGRGRHLLNGDDFEFYTGNYDHIGTLPLVFAIHGYLTTARSMQKLLPLADDYHFVLVFPEGLEQSFNAGACCGYALENNIDDVGYLEMIQAGMAAEFFGFVNPLYTFGIGHNNGAFLLTYALERSQPLFRSIVPISGYTHHVDLVRSGLNSVHNAANGIGIMLHHSLDDSIVRPSGCCVNTKLPQCHGDIQFDPDHPEYCWSVLQMLSDWAMVVNKCDDSRLDHSTVGFKEVVGTSGEVAYALTYVGEDQYTALTFNPDFNSPQKEVDVLYKTDLALSVTYQTPFVTCVTTESPSCTANSTLCLYTDNGGEHGFHGNDFDNEFFMHEEVFDFIAKEACVANGGVMTKIPGNPATGKNAKRVCACPVSFAGESNEDEFGGVYCLDPLNEDGTFKLPSLGTTGGGQVASTNPGGSKPEEEVPESTLTNADEVTPEQGMPHSSQQQNEPVALQASDVQETPYSPLPDGVTPDIYEPTWYKRRTGWRGATYQGAVDFCASVGKNLCPYQVYCGGGPRSPIFSGGIVELSDYEDRDFVLSRDVQWAPIINTNNEWIQILEGDDSCLTHTMLAGKQPSWGSSTEGDQTVTGYLMCCHTRWGITEMAGVTATPTPKPTTVEPASQLADNSAHLGSNTQQLPDQTEQENAAPSSDLEQEWEKQQTEEVSLSSPYGHLPDGVTPEMYEPTWYKRRTGWQGAAYQEAVDFCAMMEQMLCPYQVYCSGGPKSIVYDGGAVESSDYEDRDYVLSKDEQWSPIANSENEFVQILEGDESCYTHTMLAGKQPSWMGTKDGARTITGYLMCCRIPGPGTTGMSDVAANPTPKPATAEPSNQLIDNSASQASMEEMSIDNSATQSSMEETQNAAGLFPLESIQQETDTSATLPSFTIETLPVESTSAPPKKETPESPGQSNENKMSSPGVTVMNKPVSPKESSQVANETNQISLASNAGDMSDTNNSSKDSDIHVTWMLVLLAIFTLLGLGLMRRRRRRAEYARALAQQRARYQDALEFRRAGNPSSPYRDYFQGGDNGNGFEDDTNIDDVSDHSPSQYESETAIGHGKSPAGDLDDLGQSQWDDGYRFSGKLSDTAKKIFGSTDMKDAVKQDIMDDYSFSPSSSVDDSDAASQGSHQSKSYLNPSDLNMLQKFRQKTKSKKPDPDAAIIRRQSETEDSGSSYRVSFTRKDSKDVFDDLEDIEKDIV